MTALDDAQVADIIGSVVGESLSIGSEAVYAVASEIGTDMADWWEADDAFLDLVRKCELLLGGPAARAGSCDRRTRHSNASVPTSK